MNKSQRYRLGKIHSLTIPVPNLEQATEFYCKILGFKPQRGQHPVNQLLLESEGVPIILSQVEALALMRSSLLPSPVVMLALETSNLAATLERLKANGVELIDETPQQFGQELRIDFRDPFGHRLRLVQPQRWKVLERPPADQLPKWRGGPTKRDIEVLRALYDYRILTSQQIHRLVFASDTPDARYGKLKRCQQRLRKLWLHGYVFRDEIPAKISEGKQPLVYSLDRQGARLIADLLDLPLKEIERKSHPGLHSVTSLHLNHLLRTNDIRIKFTLDAQPQGWKITQYVSDQDLNRDYDRVSLPVNPKQPEGKTRQIAIIPDGYWVLWTGQAHFHHFVECDLRTITGEYSEPGLKDWSRRVRALVEYYRSGMYHQRFQGGKSLRILTVSIGERRVANLKQITEKVAGKHKQRFLYTTFEKLESAGSSLTEPIWQVAGRSELHPLVWHDKANETG
jgi:catechol 2,3-dioxygenase-like lactoylglutathione lyase family enzyme